MPRDWSQSEVEACVADYLQMLTLELTGQSYSKTAHRNALRQLLDDRTDSSIEMKHRNISAVLLELGCPHVIGYKPLTNYQRRLFDTVEKCLRTNSILDEAAISAVEQPATVPALLDYSAVDVAPPTPRHVGETAADYVPRFAATKRDYLVLESRNRSLGDAGERFVIEYEIQRLHTLGKKALADRVEQVSATQGDGLGFDILSFEESGEERLIEVKTTAFARETPFHVTRTELACSEHRENFHLYRVFEFRKSPKMFQLPGLISKHCHLDPVNFVAKFSW